MFKSSWFIVIVAGAAWLTGCQMRGGIAPLGQRPGDRVGWEENFASAERWTRANEKPASGSPLVNVEAQGGVLTLQTACGALDPKYQRKDWPEWPEKPATGYTTLAVEYDQAVDFDRYHYLVAHVKESGVFALLSVNGKPTKVLWGPGVHAQDLAPLGIKGTQRPKLSIQFLNSSNWIKLASLRLVSALSEKEKQGFIGEGIVLRDENLMDKPYHRLEALNARAGRPIKSNPLGGERVVFRDTATGAECWRMTAGPGDQAYVTWNADGSAFKLAGHSAAGFDVYDFTTGKYVPVKEGLGDAGAHFSSVDPSSLILARLKRLEGGKRRISFVRSDFRKGTEMEIASFETTEPHAVYEMSTSPRSGKILFGMRETAAVALVDPEIADPQKRVRQITLPTRLKGLGFGASDEEIHWLNCYTFERWMMDLKTGKVEHSPLMSAGSHAIGGKEFTIAPYAELMKLYEPEGMRVQREGQGVIKIWANFRQQIETDYGSISRDGQWAVTDGVKGDLAGQHLMFSVKDPATVLRVVKHHTSRNEWTTNTYSYPSPDATKLAWMSDQLGDGDIYIAVTGRPMAPRELKADPAGKNQVKLTWEAPDGVRELAGYRVYRSTTSGRGFVALNREPVRGMSFADTLPEGTAAASYLVAMVEPSGLEGHFSNEAAVPQNQNVHRTFTLKSDQAQCRPPFRMTFEGTRLLRIHHASPDELRDGTATFHFDAPPGKYSLWLRARPGDQSGSIRCTVGSSGGLAKQSKIDVPRLKVPKQGFDWFMADQVCEVSGDKGTDIALASSTEGLTLDDVLLSTDQTIATKGLLRKVEGESARAPDEADAGGRSPRWPLTLSPSPVVSLHSSDRTPSSLKLHWEPSPERNIARYDIHEVPDDKTLLGNATIIGSTTGCAFEDWGLKPGATYHYKVVAVDTRGNSSAAARLDVTTVKTEVQSERIEGKKQGDLMSFPVEIKGDGPFMLWCAYAPGFVEGQDLVVPVLVDGKPVGKWKLRAPYKPMWRTFGPARNQERREFVDKIVADGKDLFELAKGSHVVTIQLDGKLGEKQHLLRTLTVSNDQSYRPSRYDPRADFGKTRQ